MTLDNELAKKYARIISQRLEREGESASFDLHIRELGDHIRESSPIKCDVFSRFLADVCAHIDAQGADVTSFLILNLSSVDKVESVELELFEMEQTHWITRKDFITDPTIFVTNHPLDYVFFHALNMDVIDMAGECIAFAKSASSDYGSYKTLNFTSPV